MSLNRLLLAVLCLPPVTGSGTPVAPGPGALDITGAEHPREVSTVTFGDDEMPHWAAIDPTSRRVVVNSGGNGKGNRLFVANFDPATGGLLIDERFRDAGGTKPGISLTGARWPHGFAGTAVPHGAAFSR